MITFVARRHVAARGFYSVHVRIIGRAAGRLTIKVSHAPAERVTLKDGYAKLAIRAWSHGHTLVVHFRGRLKDRPKLRISKHHLPAPDRSLSKRVASAGLYSVRVIVSTKSRTANHVKLKIGTTPYVVTARPNAPATVTTEMQLTPSLLAVKASGSQTKPDVTVQLAKVIPAAAPAPVAPVTASAASGPLVPTGVPGTWNLIFDDEFTATSLNAANWSTGWFGSGITKSVTAGEPECYDPSHAVETNGELDLSLTQASESCGGATQPYTSGIVTTNGKFSFTYGFVEVRAWLPTLANGQAADWPAIWLDGQSWPNDGEIDLMEGLGGSVCAHWHGPTNGGAGYGAGGGTGCPAGTFTGGWHTFAADWEPGSVTFYYDGKDIGSVTNSTSTITGSPMYVILNLAGEPGGGTTAPATLRIKYVRVWQH